MGEDKLRFSADELPQRILVLRGERVMIDSDLAELYGVTTKRFNEQVKRNLERFPIDFMFQVTPEEKAEVVANCDHLVKLKFSPHLPRVTTTLYPHWWQPSGRWRPHHYPRRARSAS